MSQPFLTLAPDEVLVAIPVDAVDWLNGLIIRAELDRRRNGLYSLPPARQRAKDAFALTSVSMPRTSNVHDERAPASSLANLDSRETMPERRLTVSTAELSTQLRCTDGHARRLAAQYGVTTLGARNHWPADAAAVITARRAAAA